MRLEWTWSRYYSKTLAVFSDLQLQQIALERYSTELQQEAPLSSDLHWGLWRKVWASELTVARGLLFVSAQSTLDALLLAKVEWQHSFDMDC